MIIRCNETYRFTKQFEPISQEDIARTPSVTPGDSLAVVLAKPTMPESVRSVIRDLPYCNDRLNTWIFVRPQYVDATQPDARIGAFYHLDVDVIYRCVSKDWDDFKNMVVSFGDIAETEFISEPTEIEVHGPPTPADYVSVLPQISHRTWPTERPAPGQVAEYTVRDFHRAGPIRKSGWRLVIIVVQTNAPTVESWPPV